MSWDRKVFRASQDAVGAPGDSRAVNATDDNTMVALLKGLYALLSGTITVTTPVGAATSAKQDTGNTALASILAKIIAAPATEAKQDTANTALATLATQTTAAAILAKLIAAPATEAKQDTGNTSLASIASLLTTQAGYLDGLEALIGTTNGKDFATQTTLAAVLAKLNSSVAVTGTFWQATQPVSLAVAPALVASSAVIGKVGIDQTTDGTTNLVAAKQSGTWNVTVNAALPAGANAIGKLAANSGVTIGAVELAAAQTLATVTNLAQLAGVAISMNTGVRSTGTQRVTIATDDLVPVSIASVPSHAVTNAGTFAVQATEADGANVTLGAKADAKSTATDTTSVSAMSVWKQISASVQAIATSVAATLAIKHVRSSTGTQTSVAGSAADGTILASNANRLGASVYNDSSVVLYLLLASATSSSTNYSVQLAGNAYFEVPANYTGVIKGLWASATGNARVMEYS